jgi:cytochrome c oxidase subunit 3
VSAVADAHAHGHGAHPPTAHASSRANPVLLGIYLFIASEAMLFGSFFAAYFFARVSANPETWPPEPYHLPVYLALLNTIILVTSSFTVHWALHGVKTGHRAALIGGRGRTNGPGQTLHQKQINE